jgi:hypothetical protein
MPDMKWLHMHGTSSICYMVLETTQTSDTACDGNLQVIANINGINYETIRITNTAVIQGSSASTHLENTVLSFSQ